MTRYTKFRKSFNKPSTFAFNRIGQKQAEASEPDEKSQEKNTIRRHNKVCLCCRKKGHSMEDCTKKDQKSNTSSSCCYRCGSTEHTLRDCHVESSSSNELAFAECFVCKAKGHISRDCPQNPNGVYPNGGSCHHCGSTRHFAKDCDARKKAASGSDNELIKKKQPVNKPKVVRF